MARLKALLDFAKYRPARLRTFGAHIHVSMKGNPAFLTPAVSMDALAAQVDTFGGLVADALDGSRKVIAERNRQRVLLIGMLKQLAYYVEAAANENEAVFISSGFKIAPTTRTQTAPRNEGIRKIVFGPNSGTLKLKAIDVLGASSYELRFAPRQIDRSPLDSEWTTKRFSDTRKFLLITGLQRGTSYVFQVRALIGEEFTDWSDSVTQVCV